MGFHTSAEYGALGDKIFSAKPGTVIGPVPLDSGYSIIKVQERRNGKEKTYEEAKYDIAEELRTSWENIAFVNALQKLQQKSSVVVDREKLKRLPYIDPELLVQGE
jgi:parvulin-like peptidyl-prolyl isomerase